jgi:hypothetical protein
MSLSSRQPARDRIPERRLYHKYPLNVGEKGRKTGWQPRRPIRKDSDGLDNVEDFFAGSSSEEDGNT